MILPPILQLQPTYITVFDVMHPPHLVSGIDIVPAVACCLLAVPVLLQKRYRQKHPKVEKQEWEEVLSMFVALLMVFAIVLIGLGQRDRWIFRKAFIDGQYRSTEGEVRNYEPAFYYGKSETFTVSGVRFQYSSGEASSAFNRTFVEGGPVREGLHVRIADVDGKIVRLEIRQNPSTSR